MKYTVTFERVDRKHSLPPLDVDGDSDIGEQIHDYVRPHLVSRRIDIHYSLQDGTGFILCGFHDGGQFTIRENVERCKKTDLIKSQCAHCLGHAEIGEIQ